MRISGFGRFCALYEPDEIAMLVQIHANKSSEFTDFSGGGRKRLPLKIILTTPTPHISKKYDPKICHKMRGPYGIKIPSNKGTSTENVVHEPTFMAYELRLLWRSNPPLYAI